MTALSQQQADTVRNQVQTRARSRVLVRKSQRLRPGDRIELSDDTRRLPGGLRSRIEAQQVPDPAPIPPSAETPAPPDSGRRVLRDANGVIIGVKPEPRQPIVGTIVLPKRRVVVAKAAEKPPRREGRASAHQRRQDKHIKRPFPKRPTRRGQPAANNTVQMRDAKKHIRIDGSILVSDLAHRLSQKTSRLVRGLWETGVHAAAPHSPLDLATAQALAAKFGYTVEDVGFHDKALLAPPPSDSGTARPPVVTVMGHVDHGKTSLLDAIRKTTVAAGEAGGITQHLGAYRVPTVHGDIVFVDTPGHEAFVAMRTRGAQVTDIVVLIVAADDGVMPTTVEVIEAAQRADKRLLVVMTKVDKAEANCARVKQRLLSHGVIGEEFGGDTTICEVSSKTGEGISQLLEVLALQAEVMELRAVATGPAAGVVLEARVDKGRGVVTTVLVTRGTLRKGDVLVADEVSGKIRGMRSDRGTPVVKAPPGTPVEITGLDGAPCAGDPFANVPTEREAKQLVEHRRGSRRRKEAALSAPPGFCLHEVPTLKVVVRADAQGSVEVLKQAIDGLSTAKVHAKVIRSGVGAVNDSDVGFANASGAVIVGFNVKPAAKTARAAGRDGTTVVLSKVLYELTAALTEMMVALLEPVYEERNIGEAQVRMLFAIPGVGVVAGCRVLKGKVTRHSHVRVHRGSAVVHSGIVGSLRIVKRTVTEVGEGHECGVIVANYADVRPDDLLEAYELAPLKPSLT